MMASATAINELVVVVVVVVSPGGKSEKAQSNSSSNYWTYFGCTTLVLVVWCLTEDTTAVRWLTECLGSPGSSGWVKTPHNHLNPDVWPVSGDIGLRWSWFADFFPISNHQWRCFRSASLSGSKPAPNIQVVCMYSLYGRRTGLNASPLCSLVHALLVEVG